MFNDYRHLCPMNKITQVIAMFTDKRSPVKCLPGNEVLIRASGGSMKELQEYRKKYSGCLHGAGNSIIAKAYKI